MTKDYWKKRCELAEKYIEESPCDPDIYKEQMIAYNNWMEFKKFPIPVVVESEAVVCPKCKSEHTQKRGYGFECIECWHKF